MKFKFKLGQRVKDKITSFEGIIISRSQWLNSCNTYGIQSETLNEGKPVDRQYFDAPQLEFVSDKKQVHNPEQETGGPATAPKSTRHPDV